MAMRPDQKRNLGHAVDDAGHDLLAEGPLYKPRKARR